MLRECVHFGDSWADRRIRGERRSRRAQIEIRPREFALGCVYVYKLEELNDRSLYIHFFCLFLVGDVNRGKREGI